MEHADIPPMVLMFRVPEYANCGHFVILKGVLSYRSVTLHQYRVLAMASTWVLLSGNAYIHNRNVNFFYHPLLITLCWVSGSPTITFFFPSLASRCSTSTWSI